MVSLGSQLSFAKYGRWGIYLHMHTASACQTWRKRREGHGFDGRDGGKSLG